MILSNLRGSSYLNYMGIKFLPKLYGDKIVIYGKLICEKLDKLKIPYEKQTKITQRLNISKIILNKISDKEKLFLSYLLRKEYGTISSKLKQEIKEYLLTKHNTKIFTLENDFIWIKKSS